MGEENNSTKTTKLTKISGKKVLIEGNF